VDFAIYWENFGHRHEPSPEIIESVVDAMSHIILFGVITALAVGWYGILMSSKRLERAFPLRKTRLVIIITYVAYAATYIILTLLEGQWHLVEHVSELADAVYSIFFAAIISWSLVTLTRWLRTRKADESEKFKKIENRNRFLIAVIIVLLIDAAKAIAIVNIHTQFLPYVRFVVRSINEIVFIMVSLCIFFFSQNYLFVIGFGRGYFNISEIPSSHSGTSTPTPNSAKTSTYKSGSSNVTNIKQGTASAKSASARSAVASLSTVSSSESSADLEKPATVSVREASEDEVQETSSE